MENEQINKQYYNRRKKQSGENSDKHLNFY